MISLIPETHMILWHYLCQYNYCDGTFFISLSTNRQSYYGYL